ncbi:GNAT family N-acetyltransferase [Marinomonas mediterranea]|jgi:Acetyltransferases|uniref:GCN5-related N-acetyltransferase n=1 Tax=Marinomonas mediterranea (strain ATCC 700492 / JCM 21426 / NBRC 103028 / MMB-1) TaxID=717774 RepID=F2JV99_MARM1|nr:GNAT family N-acetyltransferase [Marinomonas mediterranea]ADZ92857.1 GCN5-related N-acetyltransferase [Marinomonas mediterranea MMB-1]WCN10790.1 GNAT family N-acetyltransferase [Marinomonas mediterranea]WCN18879.1 GNAT family N-acetyltransferase [Marinomonas mediterranea MMB-1]
MTPILRTTELIDIDKITALNCMSNPFPWSDRLIKESILNRVSWVLESTSNDSDDGKVVAWLVASSICGQSELELVLVDKAERRKGYAESLLLVWKQWALEHQHDELQLEVRESNNGAIRLYKKMGFEEVGRRKNYYTNDSGKEAACLMSLFLK